MTASARASTPTAEAEGPALRSGFALTADGSYAACLATDREGNWFPERWTLHGPEPYTVPLPCAQPEEPDSSVLPLADGRVLIRRYVGGVDGADEADGEADDGGGDRDGDEAAGQHTLSLLHPSGPDTSELPLGSVAATGALALVPPAPESPEVYALAPAGESTAIWRVHGGSSEGSTGPERVAEVPGRCTGGCWLDRAGQALAVDRELAGRTKTVVVDLHGGGEVSPLLQITDDSNDRLLLAEPDSGLLLVRSDAPGQERLGWGVLGSRQPVRFPEALRSADTAITPFAVQPGQALMPENCGVALRLEGPAGCGLGVWWPAVRRLVRLPPLPGWITGAGLWTHGGELRLPYATGAQLCGLARLSLPVPGPAAPPAPPAPATPSGPAAPPAPSGPAPLPAQPAAEEQAEAAAPRPVPLQKAPL